MYRGHFKIIVNTIAACDYHYVIKRLLIAYKKKESLLISPIASHTLVRAYYNTNLQKNLSQFDLLVPDSQWVKRALWFLHSVRLKKRVYGPDLMLNVCERAEKEKISVMLYGATTAVLHNLEKQLSFRFPDLILCESMPSLFRPLKQTEKKKLIVHILHQKPAIIFVGLGSPLQEEFSLWIAEKIKTKHSAVIIPVGAAFDFISRTKPQAPQWMGNLGLEWLYRLLSEPGRLWKRYIIDGFLFIYLVLKQKIELSRS